MLWTCKTFPSTPRPTLVIVRPSAGSTASAPKPSFQVDFDWRTLRWSKNTGTADAFVCLWNGAAILSLSVELSLVTKREKQIEEMTPLFPKCSILHPREYKVTGRFKKSVFVCGQEAETLRKICFQNDMYTCRRGPLVCELENANCRA